MKNEKCLLKKIEDFIYFKIFIKKIISENGRNNSNTLKKVKNLKRFIAYSVQEKFKLSLYCRMKSKFYLSFLYIYIQKYFDNQDYFSITRYHSKKNFFWGDIFFENFIVLGVIGEKNLRRYSDFFFFINWQILQFQTKSYTQFLCYEEIGKKRILKEGSKNILPQNTKLEIRKNFRFILIYQIKKWNKKGLLFVSLKNSFKKVFHKKKEKISNNFEKNLSILRENYMLNKNKQLLTREFIFYIHLISILSNRDSFFLMLIRKNTSLNIITLFFEKIRKSFILNKEKTRHTRKNSQEYFLSLRQHNSIYLDMKSKNKNTKNKILFI